MNKNVIDNNEIKKPKEIIIIEKLSPTNSFFELIRVFLSNSFEKSFFTDDFQKDFLKNYFNLIS